MKNFKEFVNRDLLDIELATTVAGYLTSAIEKNGKASIAFSGGSTPKGLFNALSVMDLPWDKVTITLADERWVDFDDEASNTRLLHENLLQNNAKSATFFHLKSEQEFSESALVKLNGSAKALLPLDVLILGMGEDGHTASLFPCSDEITEGLSLTNNNALMKVVPKTAPHERITFTFNTLIASKNIILHVCGESKKDVLAKAEQNNNIKEMPIRAFLQHNSVTTDIYWAV